MVIAIILLAILFIAGLINTVYYNPSTKKISAWFLSNFVTNPISTTITIEAAKSSGSAGGKEDQLKKVFATFDKNGDGFITRRELKESLENIGIVMTEKETDETIEKLDKNGDGLLDLHEFCELFESMIKGEGDEKYVPGEEVGEEELKEAFSVFDGNRDGLITVQELFLVLSSLGLKEGKKMEDCMEMIRKVDLDGDGMVNFVEFKRMMKAGRRLHVPDS